MCVGGCGCSFREGTVAHTEAWFRLQGHNALVREQSAVERGTATSQAHTCRCCQSQRRAQPRSWPVPTCRCGSSRLRRNGNRGSAGWSCQVLLGAARLWHPSGHVAQSVRRCPTRYAAREPHSPASVHEQVQHCRPTLWHCCLCVQHIELGELAAAHHGLEWCAPVGRCLQHRCREEENAHGWMRRVRVG